MSTNIDLPNFDEREILLHEKLNAMAQAIVAKFLAGVGSADIAWPLIAEGNLDMSIYEITGGRKIWNYVNAAAYPTFEEAVDAAGIGGVVVVPPDTTVTSSGDVDYSNLGAIIGAGASSVIQFTSGAASSLLFATVGTNMLISNVTLDGNAEAGTIIGVNLSGATESVLSNVWFKNFSSTMLNIVDCTNVLLDHCHFSGGAAEHVKATAAGLLFMRGCTSDGADGIALHVESSGAGAVNVVMLDDVAFSNCGSNAVKIFGWNAVGAASPAEVYASNVVVSDSAGATAAVLLGGATTDSLRVAVWHGGSIAGSTSGGISVNATAGSISDVVIIEPVTFGIDMDTSQYLNVHDCRLEGDGAGSTVGIDGSGVGVGCMAHHNNITGFTTSISSSANLASDNNNGAAEDSWVDYTTASVNGSSAAVSELVIPADVVRDGGVVEIDWAFLQTNATSGDTVTLRLNGQVVHTEALSGSGGTFEYVYRTTIAYTGATTGRAITIGGVTTAMTGSSAALTSLAWTAAQTLDIYLTFTAAAGPTITGRLLAARYIPGVVS